MGSTAESAAVLRQRGIAEKRIHVRGIPIGKSFTPAASQPAGTLRMDPQRLTVLVTSGGVLVRREGTFMLDGDVLVGGWSEIYGKGWAKLITWGDFLNPFMTDKLEPVRKKLSQIPTKG